MPFVDYSFGNWILKYLFFEGIFFYLNFYFRSTFIYRRPKLTASSTTLFLRPLDSKVWYCLVVSVVIILVLLKITLDTEYLFLIEIRSILEKTWSYLMLFVVAAFCQQGNVIINYLKI